MGIDAWGARWLRPIGPDTPDFPGQIRLVCFPHAGGAATSFQALAGLLAPSVRPIAVQYPGRQDRRSEPMPETIDELAGEAAARVAALGDRPVALYGHSMGAAVAFEVARRLPVAPAWLFVSGRRPPGPATPGEMLHLLPDPELAARMARLGGTDPRILADEEARTDLLVTVRQDLRAIERHEHRPGPPLSCPVTALVGDADPQVPVARMHGWRRCTTARFQLHVLRGGHFFAGTALQQLGRLLSAPFHLAHRV
jgi:pyochelin biosynthesis protein PchC